MQEGVRVGIRQRYVDHSVHERSLQADVESILYLEIIFDDQIPHCTECDGIIKPGRARTYARTIALSTLHADIVFFGESLPARFQECVATVSDASIARRLSILTLRILTKPIS
jgi:NAD-dependent SIR2 family protein deacetylase